MRTSVLRWLLQRRVPEIPPLYQRDTWPNFEARMHRAIALDVAIELGLITRAELRARQQTRPLPTIYEADTVADPPRYWRYLDECETMGVACEDIYATLPDVELVSM